MFNFTGYPGTQEFQAMKAGKLLSKKLVYRRCEEFIPVHYKDWDNIIANKMQKRWKARWRNTNNKLEVTTGPGELKRLTKISRREEVVLNRIRTEHSRFTHGYLMDDAQPDIIPGCPLCNEAQLTIKHILLVCPAAERQRRQCIGTADVSERSTIRDILGRNMKMEEVLTLL